jgi:large subunit ribosomal protein L27e
MGKVLKQNKIVLVLQGRHAGKAGIVVKTFEGTQRHPFQHALVLGLERYPKKITNKMSKKKIRKRLRMKLFAKFINYTHLMPTRYSLTNKYVDTKNFPIDCMEVNNQEQKKKTLKKYAKAMMEMYETTPKGVDKTHDLMKFFRKLRF